MFLQKSITRKLAFGISSIIHDYGQLWIETCRLLLELRINEYCDVILKK